MTVNQSSQAPTRQHSRSRSGAKQAPLVSPAFTTALPRPAFIPATAAGNKKSHTTKRVPRKQSAMVNRSHSVSPVSLLPTGSATAVPVNPEISRPTGGVVLKSAHSAPRRIRQELVVHQHWAGGSANAPHPSELALPVFD